jgi:mRNA-degrading endonuclease RelE of RelBE toxin-antitoxin system
MKPIPEHPEKYEVYYANRRIEKALEQLPPHDFERIDAAITALEDNPRPFKSKKVQASKEDTYGLRVWPYRVIYDVYDDSKSVIILAVIHRKDLEKYLRRARL